MEDRNTRYFEHNMRVWGTAVSLFGLVMLLLTGVAAIWLHPFKLLFAAGCVTFILLEYAGYRYVRRRYQQIDRIFRLFTEGYLAEELFEQPVRISPSIEKTFAILAERLDKTKLLNVSKKQAQYLALQNQINPHFLYNTLEGIRSEALIAGMDGVASMTEALATFFRYTISNVDHLVTLEDELSNIENYYIIQQYRFGDKLSLSIEYDDDDDDLSVLNLKLPKLTLQPIVENSIYHGIERKIGKGNLRIRIDYTRERLIIRIGDDGLGMAPELLEKLNGKLLSNSLEGMDYKKEQKGGIAVINVNNRIKLLFGEEYGIHIYSKLTVGTDVEITLPVITE